MAILPDGDRFLFASYDGRLTLEVKMGTLSSGAVRTIMPVPSLTVQVMPPDRLVYLRDGELRAQRIDFAEGTLLGEPETLATGVPGSDVRGAFAVSARGMLAYRADSAPMQLAWFDRSGRMVGPVGGASEEGTSAWARVSPDGGRVAPIGRCRATGTSGCSTRPGGHWSGSPPIPTSTGSPSGLPTDSGSPLNRCDPGS